jgi:hypothetical protein
MCSHYSKPQVWSILGLLWLPAVNIPCCDITVNLAITESATNLHEEDLVLIFRPFENLIPQQEGVACGKR